MPFASTDIIKTIGNLGADVESTALNPHLQVAEIELRSAITDSVYDSKLADDTTADYKQLQLSEANLALSYAIHSLNNKTQGNGFVGATGFDQSRQELLHRSEIERMSEHYKDVAERLYRKFVPVTSNSSFKLSAV